MIYVLTGLATIAAALITQFAVAAIRDAIDTVDEWRGRW